MQVLSTLLTSAYFTDLNLLCLHPLPHGEHQHSARNVWRFRPWLWVARNNTRSGFSPLQRELSIRQARLRPRRQARLRRLVKQRSTSRWEWLPSGRSRSATAIDFMRAAFRAAIRDGRSDLRLLTASTILSRAFSCGTIRSTRFGASSEMALDFARKAKFDDVADVIVSQQRFIATMQGRTATFSTFSDEQFDEAAFEAQLTADSDRHDDLLVLDPQIEGTVPVRRLRRGARGSRQGEGPCFGPQPLQVQLLDYFYYAALTVAALYENAFGRRAARMARTPDGSPGATARVGRKLSADFRRQARTGVGRDRPPRRARRRCDASVRRGYSIGP